jgi:hypothetical protein
MFDAFSIHERYAEDQREDESCDEVNSGFGCNKKEIAIIQTIVKSCDCEVFPCSMLLLYRLNLRIVARGVYNKQRIAKILCFTRQNSRVTSPN